MSEQELKPCQCGMTPKIGVDASERGARPIDEIICKCGLMMRGYGKTVLITKWNSCAQSNTFQNGNSCAPISQQAGLTVEQIKEILNETASEWSEGFGENSSPKTDLEDDQAQAIHAALPTESKDERISIMQSALTDAAIIQSKNNTEINSLTAQIAEMREALENIVEPMDLLGYPHGQESDRVFPQYEFDEIRAVLAKYPKAGT